MAEEEVLGEEESRRPEEEADEEDDSAGLMSMAGGLMDSFVVKMLIGAIVVVTVLLLVALVSWYTFQNLMAGTTPEETGGQVGQARVAPYQTYALENDFVITKRDDEGGRRTLKLSIVLAFDSQNQPVKQELQQRQAQIRNRIYEILGSKSVDQINYRNQPSLREEVQSEINELLVSGYRIQDVYFEEFVIQ